MMDRSMIRRLVTQGASQPIIKELESLTARLEAAEKENKRLAEELAITDKLLAASDEVVKSIPACPVHGEMCKPHAKEWILSAIEQAVQIEALTNDAERYRWIRDNGSAHSKRNSKAVIEKEKGKALFAFRYWCEPKELDAAIDTEREGKS